MNEKHIKQLINKKLNSFIDSVKDEEVKKLIRKNTIISGGAITSLMLNEKPKDYDLYFRNKNATIKIAKYFVNIFNENHGKITNKIGKITKAYVVNGKDIKNISDDKIGIFDKDLSKILGNDIFYTGPGEESSDIDRYVGMTRMIASMAPEEQNDRVKIYVQSDGVAGETDTQNRIEDDIEDLDDIEHEEDKLPPYTPIYLTTNAITLSDGIQLIIRFYGEPEDIHNTFDYQHTKSYFTSYKQSSDSSDIQKDLPKSQLVIPKDVYEAVLNKQLRYTGSKYPICSLFRMRKFLDRGWRINAGQIVKMSYQISKLDLENIDVLEDQLIGVDSLYFTALINGLRSKIESDKDFILDQGYLISIIDKIF